MDPQCLRRHVGRRVEVAGGQQALCEDGARLADVPTGEGLGGVGVGLGGLGVGSWELGVSGFWV